MFDRIFGQPSARIVAIARLALALVFFVATLLSPDVAQSTPIDRILGGYVLFAAMVTWISWNNWWVDARIAPMVHAADIIFFMILVLWPKGYASPYFLFFIFLLLSAAIRWGWRATSITAAVVVNLYMAAGLLFARSGTPLDLQRFIIRTGSLIVLSALLIWFGLRWRSVASLRVAPLADVATSDDSPLPTALAQLAAALGTRCGLLIWAYRDGDQEALGMRGREIERLAVATAAPPTGRNSFLFDIPKDRALLNWEAGTRRFQAVSAIVERPVLQQVSGHQGIGIPVHNHLGQGLFLFWEVPDLHSDHLNLGDRLASQLTQLLERRALQSEREQSAMARERWRLARDLHDGIVQFLAGSTYKIEAIGRSLREKGDVSGDLEELKQLMLVEQQDLRSSIAALRKGDISLAEVAAEAGALCERLGRQWQVRCDFHAEVCEGSVSARLHRDVLQIIREAVANAVRHSSAEKVNVSLGVDAERIELAIVSDGAPKDGELGAGPWSIRERVEDSGGTMSIGLEKGAATLAVHLPVRKEHK